MYWLLYWLMYWLAGGEDDSQTVRRQERRSSEPGRQMVKTHTVSYECEPLWCVCVCVLTVGAFVSLSLGPLVSKVKEYQVETIVDTLCTNMLSDKEQLRDISSIGLKTVIGELPPASSGTNAQTVVTMLQLLCWSSTCLTSVCLTSTRLSLRLGSSCQCL